MKRLHEQVIYLANKFPPGMEVYIKDGNFYGTVSGYKLVSDHIQLIIDKIGGIDFKLPENVEAHSNQKTNQEVLEKSIGIIKDFPIASFCKRKSDELNCMVGGYLIREEYTYIMVEFKGGNTHEHPENLHNE